MLCDLKIFRILALVLWAVLTAAAQPKDSVMEKRRVDARTVLKLKLAPVR
jgi:hypothetical protein